MKSKSYSLKLWALTTLENFNKLIKTLLADEEALNAALIYRHTSTVIPLAPPMVNYFLIDFGVYGSIFIKL